MGSTDSEPEPGDASAEVHAPEVHVPVSSDGQVVAPAIEKRYFATWADFFKHLEVYQDETHQVFKKRTSTSVKARNKTLAERDKITPTTEIPEAFEKYYCRLICTHGWSRASRSAGKRDSYFSMSTKCEAQLSVTVVWAGEMGFRVKVTQQITSHNHTLGQRVYANHPSNRRIDDPEVIDFVDELQAAGAKNKLIMKYLRQRTGKQVTLRDVHNLVAKLRDTRRGATTVESRLECCLRDFCSQTGNAAAIYVDDDKLAQTITFQTQQMRRFFEAFPEVMMIDATHNTNDARYKLFSFMIHDVFGHCVPFVLKGQYVQHALMENESSGCLTDAVTSFKSVNPTWEKVRVIIVDKDFVSTRGDVKREYGVLDREKVEDAVNMMLNAPTETEYDTARKYVYYVVEGKQISSVENVPEPVHPFVKYFRANWHQCRRMWSRFGRSDVPHLGNTTNNRLEAAWGHLKGVLKPTMMLDEGADSELEKLAKEVSQHAYKLVEKQYRVANDRKTFYTVREISNHVRELASSVDPTCTYHLDTKVYRCTCTFMETELLPCRHVIYWRLISDKSPIPLNHIHPRWSLTCPLNIPIEDDKTSDNLVCSSFRVTDSSLRADRHKVLNGTNKFRTAHDVCCRVADLMSRNGRHSGLPENARSTETFRGCGERRRGTSHYANFYCVQLLLRRESAVADFVFVSGYRQSSECQRWRLSPTLIPAASGSEHAKDDRDSLGFTKTKSHSVEITEDTTDTIERISDKSHSYSVTQDKSHSLEVTEDKSYAVNVCAEESHVLDAVPSLPKPKIQMKCPIFGFKTSPGTITLYDPQQKKKQIDTCEAIVKERFPTIVEKMEIKHEKRLKQADGVNCGPLVLHFFECSIRGIALEGPTISPALL
ncbi:hypothetical protein PF006_g4051 [Phytophthora fragariae]|uniref:SWIM-type domain-containing protein n=1 Tax=Phytophthora fragariae TaxID=53985 RepID=A0A6A3UXQ1_9STRA|nr:hypothetical protein PF006_g4051 [Phytophthora fragariae]